MSHLGAEGRLAMSTTADIVDTAVKIGLGAIISAVVTLLMFRLNHKKERSQRRQELLEEVAKYVASVDRAGLRYWQIICWSLGTEDEQSRKLEGIKEEAAAASTSAQATLWLLGENKCCELFKEYEDVIWEIPKAAYMGDEEYQKARQPLRNKRIEFFAELHKTYSKL
jgi:hypothetical protein